jgi:hypothetical protein
MLVTGLAVQYGSEKICKVKEIKFLKLRPAKNYEIQQNSITSLTLKVFDCPHTEVEQHFSGPELPKETNYTAIHMKQSSDRPYIHPNPIIGAFPTTDSEKRDIKKKVLRTDERTDGRTDRRTDRRTE